MMNEEVLNDYEKISDVDQSLIQEYREKIEKFNEAVEMHGSLSYDECFGYVPLLAIGGKETTKNLKKVKIREHIALITALVGEI